MRQKTSTENLDTRPPPSLSINFFTSENFLKYSTEGLLYEMLGNCETKQFWWKNVITTPSLIVYIFRYQKFSETKKGSLTKFSALWDEKNRTWIIHSLPPSPLFHKLFRQWNISGTQHRRVPLRNVLLLWEWTSSTENRDNRTLSYPLQFSGPENFWNTEGSLDKIFRNCETKIFRR